MRIKYLFTFIIFLCFISCNAFSQNGYLKGYVITNENDTLYGSLKDRKSEPFEKLYKKIRFKSKKGRRQFSAYDIQAYKRGQDEFVSMWFNEDIFLFKSPVQSNSGRGKKQFFKLVLKGCLSYYHLEYIDEYGIDYKGFFKRDNETEMVHVRTSILGLNRKRLISYFCNCPPLQEKILNKTFNKPLELVEFYNEWYKNKQDQ